jgi:hypothetical protein
MAARRSASTAPPRDKVPEQSLSVTNAVSYKFDGVMFATNKPALLLTQNGLRSTEITPGQKFVTEFSCIGISIKVHVEGFDCHNPFPREPVRRKRGHMGHQF